MSQAVTRIKSRIKSVSSAYKVTSAMKLVSTVKLKQWKGRMMAYKDYTKEVNDIVDILLSYSKSKNIPFMNINTDATKNLYLVISSTLGLCGSYNNNIFKVSDTAITKDDEAIILGGKGIAHYKNGEFTSVPGFDEYSSVNDKDMVNKIISETPYITELAILNPSPVGTVLTSIKTRATIPNIAPNPCDIALSSSSAKEYLGILTSSMHMAIY